MAALDHLKDLVADGRVAFEWMAELADQVVAAQTLAELEQVLGRLPSVVEFTRPDRRLTEPLEIDVTTGALRLRENWQLGRYTAVTVRSGSALVDLGGATWDDRIIDLQLDVRSGTIRVVIPRGVEIQLLSIAGNVRNDTTRTGLTPGAPLLRIAATTRSGSIKLSHPPLPKPEGRWKRWRRSRAEQRALPGPGR